MRAQGPSTRSCSTGRGGASGSRRFRGRGASLFAVLALACTGATTLAAPASFADQESDPTVAATQTTEPSPDETTPSGDSTSVETPEAADETPTMEPSSDVSSSDSVVQPLIAGTPDGGTPPYVYWDVRDTAGNLVSGATFKFEARRSWSWNTGSNASSISDCEGTCRTSTSGDSLERDSDGGEWLLEHRGTTRNSSTRLSAGSNYRVSQVSPPSGYEWVVSGANTKTIGATDGNSASWSNTYDFGTFQVRKIRTAPVCTAGYVYSTSGQGQLRQVAPDGTITNLGNPAGVANFNGLGIGSGGTLVYGIQRSDDSGTEQSGTVWVYNTATGVWTTTGQNSGNTKTNLIGGAVDLSTGLYYFGGFTSSGDFRVYEYNPDASTKIKLKATVSTTAGTNANGDIAFDAEGNFYIVRGSRDQSVVYSVTKSAFQSANGGTVASSATKSFDTAWNVNGVAFDSSGKSFLGSSSQIKSYNMPNWSGPADVTSGLSDSTDLASCSSPPTIVIEKEIVGGRVSSGDQFKLELKQGSTLLGDATTSGTSTGVQDQRIGPMPTVRNVELSFSEAAAGTTNLSNYASAYQCTVTYLDGTVENLDQVNERSGKITIPSTGDAVRCVFRNSPLTANVTIHKDVTDGNGENPTARGGWTVGATSSATTGTVTKDPTANSQQTSSTGNASWKLKFNSYNDRATVNVSEVMQSGYEFKSGQCVVTKLDGTKTTKDLSGPDSTALTGVAPGDSVDCTYANKPSPGALTITKAFDSSVLDGSGNIEFTGAYTCSLGSKNVATGTWSKTGAGAAALTPDAGSPAANKLPAGATCTVSEDALPSDATGLPNSSWAWGQPSVGSAVTIESNATKNVTVTNKAERIYGNFSVTKNVPEGSTVTSGMTFSGDWTCERGTETVTGEWGPIASGAKWTSTDANKIPLGAECSVTSETRPANPVTGDTSYVWDGNPSLGDPVNAVSGNGTTATITVTNATKQQLGSVTWQKIDDSAQGKWLAGSEWKLTGPGTNGAEVAVTDCQADSSAQCEGPDVDPAAGIFKIESLKWGSYTLVETKAPAGYELSTKEHTFTIGAGTPAAIDINLGRIVNDRRDAPVLPLTGGLGRDFFAIAGGGTLLIGGAAAAYALKRRKSNA